MHAFQAFAVSYPFATLGEEGVYVNKSFRGLRVFLNQAGPCGLRKERLPEEQNNF